LSCRCCGPAHFDWSQHFGFHETFYSIRDGHRGSPETFLNRFAIDYSSNFVGPQLERDFGSWRHVIEPSINYQYINGAERFRNTIVVDNGRSSHQLQMTSNMH